ncbi:hypothetical protein V2G26_009246 [Clonostachys chloroleuca]
MLAVHVVNRPVGWHGASDAAVNEWWDTTHGHVWCSRAETRRHIYRGETASVASFGLSTDSSLVERRQALQLLSLSVQLYIPFFHFQPTRHSFNLDGLHFLPRLDDSSDRTSLPSYKTIHLFPTSR